MLVRVLVLDKLAVALSAHSTDTALGIMLFYQSVQPGYVNNTFSIDVGFSYYSISFALNVILTLMIVIRLILHSRNIRAAMETTTKAGGLYRVVVVVLVESSALYAGTFLLYIIPWGLKASEQFISFPVLANAQVRAVSYMLRS